MLCIKTGMVMEERIARSYAAPGTLVLTGDMTVADLDRVVPYDCEAIMSFGLCGGIGTLPVVGQCFLATTMVTPSGNYHSDPAWLHRLFTKTRAYEVHWYSSGLFNTANTPEQRASLSASTGCQIIDDESRAVYEFAARRGIVAAAMRTVSDGAEDNLPPAVIDALGKNGSTDILEVMKSIILDPAQIPSLIKTAQEAKVSLDTLEAAAKQVGPTFQWPH